MATGDISAEQLAEGCGAFAQREHRDAMYRISGLLVDQTWGTQPAEVADALGVILLTWNQAFYRYGPPDFDRIEQTLRTWQDEISRYRDSDLLRLADAELSQAKALFEDFLDATLIRMPKSGQIRRSPVSVAKVIHVLAPRSFPLWDQYIRKELGFCSGSPNSASQYVRFMRLCRSALQHLSHERSLAELEAELSRVGAFPKTILKYLDEYYYALYTKHWIEMR